MNHPLKKIVIIGPESTGKSTLAEGLAARFQTAFVAEYARAYLEQLNRYYCYDDLSVIAREQLALEDRQGGRAQNGLLFCDTDLYVIKVWSEHKYRTCPAWILETIARRHYDYYLLTGIDMEWADDPLREYPEPEMRHYFFHVYKDIVQHSGRPWALLEGDEAGRLHTAATVIEKWICGR